MASAMSIEALQSVLHQIIALRKEIKRAKAELAEKNRILREKLEIVQQSLEATGYNTIDCDNVSFCLEPRRKTKPLTKEEKLMRLVAELQAQGVRDPAGTASKMLKELRGTVEEESKIAMKSNF